MTLAYGALALVLSLTGLALLSRWYVTPVGRHRAKHAAAEPVPLEELFRPVEVVDVAWCPAEQAEHLHHFNADRTRTCCACGCTTPTAVPR